MPNGMPDAIHLDNNPRPPHRFNHRVVGRGDSYANLSADAARCVVRIRASRHQRGLFLQAFWVLASFAVARFAWGRGIQKYSAVGG